MTSSEAVRDAFPELAEITDDAVRDRVVEVWRRAVADSDYDRIEDVPWWPPLATDLSGDAPSTVEHVRQVTGVAATLADALDAQGRPLDRDLAVAGALVHDVSKPLELDGDTTGPLQDLVPHPHYSVHLLADAGFSPEYQHVALAHSPSTSVEPQTLEARVVEYADELAVDGLFWERDGELYS